MRMEFIESSLFTRLLSDYLSEEEYAALQWEIALHPETGDLIKGSGGLRKIRWASKAKGKGKRGGVRVIYYYKNQQGQIWLLTLYAKNEVEDLSKDILMKIRKELEK